MSHLGEQLLQLWSDPLSIGVVEQGAVAESIAAEYLARHQRPTAHRSGAPAPSEAPGPSRQRYAKGRCLTCGGAAEWRWCTTTSQKRRWCSPCEAQRPTSTAARNKPRVARPGIQHA
jgi:hypothetical protein